MKRLAAVAVLVGTLGLTSCGLMTPKVTKADVEQQISTQLQQQVGTTPEKIECPGDLEGKVGTTMTCKLTHQGQSLDVNLNVTAVENNTVKFDIKVADQ
ncbi:MAG: DUF4333 domain-containing protein [Propionibacteriales bacterium]|nr:DUF4333 domain-containing protein [Propionibacteriales bacterium]